MSWSGRRSWQPWRLWLVTCLMLLTVTAAWAQASAEASARRDDASGKAPTLAEQQASQQSRLQQLVQRHSISPPGQALTATEADARYRALDQDLAQLRADAEQALDGLHTSASADNHDTERRYAMADELMRALSALQAQRVALLPHLSVAERARWTGLSWGAWSRIVNELKHVQLMARWYPVQRLHAFDSLVIQLHDGLTAGRYGLGVFAVLGLVVGLQVLRARSRSVLDRWRRRLVSQIHFAALARWADGAMRMVITIAPELILLATIYLLFDQLLANIQGLPELGVLRSLAYAYAWYALALAFSHRVLLTAVSRHRVVGHELNAKIRSSLRLVGAVVLAMSWYLLLAQAALGRGALYGIAANLATVAVVLVAWRLIQRWRGEVTQAYLAFFPTGRLAGAVRATQDQGIGIGVAAAAFLYVAARGLWIWVRDVTLSFEQTRRALAYILRQQLQYQSRKQVSEAGDVELPDALVQAFSEEAAPPALRIDHHPGLDEVLARAATLRAGEHGGIVALTGERGSGKTSWLMSLTDQLPAGLPAVRHEVQDRITEPQQLYALLREVLGLSADAHSHERLVSELLQAPAQVVMIDLCQNLMLRAVGGLQAYEALLRLAEATTGRVLWVLAFARWPFEYLRRVHPHRDVFDQVIALRGWPEQAVAEMLDKRLQAAGYTANFDQLITQLSPVYSATHASPDQADRNSDRFYRLIWDYADGNPRVALHFFRLALVPSPRGDRQVDARLFPMPDANRLERFKAHAQFILAALVQHENLSAAEATRSIRFAPHECERVLNMLAQDGVLTQEAGRYRVSTHWNRAVLHFLQRKKLLVI